MESKKKNERIDENKQGIAEQTKVILSSLKEGKKT